MLVLGTGLQIGQPRRQPKEQEANRDPDLALKAFPQAMNHKGGKGPILAPGLGLGRFDQGSIAGGK